MTVAAQAGQTLVLQLFGPATTDPSGCSVGDLLSNGKKVGQQTLCFDSFTIGPAGDRIVTGHSTLALPAGNLTATGVSHDNAVSSFATGPLALPPALVDTANEWSAFVEYRTITGGTKSYKNASGSIRVSGLSISRPRSGLIWANATIVADIR